METTTTITTLFDDDSQALMTEQVYPIYSENKTPIVKESEAAILTKAFFDLKLNRYYDCIQKAKIVAAFFGVKNITLGSMFVQSVEPNVGYGYDYNPPLELHAWLGLHNGIIIDFALAGTIEKGLKTKDSIGYFLIDREPIILAGTPPPWIRYTPHEVLPLEKVNILNKETAKELLLLWK